MWLISHRPTDHSTNQAAWVDVAWWITLIFVGSILLNSVFFRPFVSHSDSPALLGIIGGLGVIVYLCVIAFVSPAKTDRWRFVVVAATTLVMLFGVTERSVLDRALSPHSVWVVSDGTVQIESAATALLQGHNPYTLDYESTAHGWRFDPWRTNTTDPARTHFAYPPGSVLFMVPLVWMAQALSLPPDGRWLSIIALVAVWVWLVRQQKNYAAKTRVTLLTLANPLLYLLAVAGFNDVIAIALVFAAGALAQRGRWVWSAAVLAFAAATKQTTWIFVLLWLVWLWLSAGRTVRWRAIGAFVITAGILILPFFCWNPSAFLTDVVLYPAGAIPATYSTAGPTIWQFIAPTLVHNPNVSIPIQVSASALGVLLGGWMILRRPTMQWWVTGGVVATLCISLVHQFFYYNYAIALVGLVAFMAGLFMSNHVVE